MKLSIQLKSQKENILNIINYKMDFSSALNKKQFFRFTGPPEHWLTAVKYMT